MSKVTQLSTGRITAADDIITITYTEESGLVLIRWPRQTGEHQKSSGYQLLAASDSGGEPGPEPLATVAPASHRS